MLPAPTPAAASARALTRAVTLADFPGCASAGAWQQAHACEAWARWVATAHPAAERIGVLNWGSAPFTGPHGARQVVSYSDRRTDDPIVWPDGSFAALFLCSVLDRVAQPKVWLRLADRALLPGGLLVATVALWDATGPDCALGHDLRARIYDPPGWHKLIWAVARGIGFRPFGGVDLRYPGPTIGDHTLAALTLTKGSLEC